MYCGSNKRPLYLSYTSIYRDACARVCALCYLILLAYLHQSAHGDSKIEGNRMEPLALLELPQLANPSPRHATHSLRYAACLPVAGSWLMFELWGT